MEILLPLIILLFSAILHEVMHGVVADRLGDPTAKLLGRLTLNPIPHLDPMMSIAVPALLVLSGSPIIFGAAKPVPVNPIHFKDPRKDMALTALAGPITNLSIAMLASQIIKLIPLDPVLYFVLYTIVIYNLMLTIINLIPIPPLDGSKVLAAILPDELSRSYLAIERFGIFILFFLLIFPLGGFSLGKLISDLIGFSLRALGVPILY
jgi:Zn-dependent protease